MVRFRSKAEKEPAAGERSGSKDKESTSFADALFCRGDRTRTCDSLVPNQERYQLRYTSVAILLEGDLPELRVQRYCYFLKPPNFSATFFILFNKKVTKLISVTLHNIA